MSRDEKKSEITGGSFFDKLGEIDEKLHDAPNVSPVGKPESTVISKGSKKENKRILPIEYWRD